VENTVSTELLWAKMIWDLLLSSGVVEWLVYWVNACDDFVGFVEGVVQIVVIFGGWYFLGIWIGALFGKIDSELILNEVSDKDSVSVLEN